jgi:hypothetical protein
MRALAIIAVVALFSASGCTLEDSGLFPPQVGTSSCSIDAQKQFVFDVMRDVYFWNVDLPATVDLAAYPTPEALLDYLISFQPLDQFSYIDLAAADARFFGAGEYEGFGFSTRFEASDELRITRVFESSPADVAGFARGQQILMLNGRAIAEIQANEGIDALFSMPTLEFTVRRQDASEFDISVSQAIVRIDPLPQYRVIDRPDGTAVGYLELVTFISTADSAFYDVFRTFQQAGVTDVVLDLRYNGGGLLSTTELLGDYLGGGVPDNTVFSRTLFNSNNSGSNRTTFFGRFAESLNLSRLVVIATERTASASELITNSMEPHVEVAIVGSNTRGKPVGQLGIEFCEKILRPTAFETVNSINQGRYFDGLAADCPAVDDLSVAIGDDADPNLVTALSLLETGACPLQLSASPALRKPVAGGGSRFAEHPLPAWQEFAGAW